MRIEPGATHVTVQRGKVIGFGTGVVGKGTSGTTLANLQVLDNIRDGVTLTGDGHRVEQSVLKRNGGHGASVSGNANDVGLLQVEDNGGDGVWMEGTGNTATRNVATRNRGDGLEIRGASAVVERNRATSNGEAGLEIHGTEHRVLLNTAGRNTGTGLEVVGTTGSRFDRNGGEKNRGFGITDDSTGGGTAGTANTYTLNVCGRDNRAGASSPAGLCR